MTPVVTIITLTYNHEKFIAECIQSVLDQSYHNWEMIIINDGSTDNTAKIVETFLGDSRIKFYNFSNVGIFRLNETYNFALSEAKGKYIAILDGDDLWEKEKLLLQVTELEKNQEVVLSWGRANSISSDKKTVYNFHPVMESAELKYYTNDPVGNILNLIFFRNCIPALTILIKKDALDKIGGFKQGYGLPLVDLPTLYELAILGKFNYIPELLGEWRIYARQVTKTYPAQMMEGFYKLSQDNYKRFKDLPAIKLSIHEDQIEKYYKKNLIIAYSRSGRYKLILGNFKQARVDYKKSILLNGFIEPVWKLRSLTGYVFSLLHMNVEGFAKLLGKKNYSEE
jgi:glycosyltransferase involved in cell wall biosynthesis